MSALNPDNRSLQIVPSRVRTLYQILMLAYPREHRQAYGEMMVHLFCDQYRAARASAEPGGMATFWFHMLKDLALNSVLEQAEQVRRSMMGNTGGGNLKIEHPAKGSLSAILLGLSILILSAGGVLLLTGLLGWGQNSVTTILLIAVLFALLWFLFTRPFRIDRNSAWAGIIGGLVVLTLVALPLYAIVEPEKILPPFLTPAQVSIFSMVSFLTPCIALVSVTFLFRAGYQFATATQSAGGGAGWVAARPRQTTILFFLLGGLILAKVVYNFYWQAIWDSTYDSLEYFLLIPPVFAVVFSGLFLAAVLPWKIKWIGLVYLALMPILFFGVFRFGKQVSPRQLTQERADQITRSLEVYRSKEGSYPRSLGQLVPWYQFSIPIPVTINGQHWCYIGEPGGYQLGAVDRDHWSSPLIYGRLYASQGNLAGAGEICSEEIRAMKEREPSYYGVQ